MVLNLESSVSFLFLAAKLQGTAKLLGTGENPLTPVSLPLPFNGGYWFNRRNKAGIYVITCLPKNKVYVGTSTNVQQRLKNHRSELGRGCHHCAALQADYNTFGKEDFHFQKLIYGSGLTNPRELNALETAILETIPPEGRYNVLVNWYVRAGADNSFYGREHSSESRRLLSEAQKGKPSPFKGASQSNEVRQLISEQNRGCSSADRRKGVFIDDVYYESVSEAHRITGYGRRIIRERCHSKREKDANFRWEHQE